MTFGLITGYGSPDAPWTLLYAMQKKLLLYYVFERSEVRLPIHSFNCQVILLN